jgi:hypothetical protein
MTDFYFTETLGSFESVLSTALGTTGASNKFGNNDLRKPVKLSTAQNYVLAAAGNEIEGFVVSVSPEDVNSGYSFGSIQTEGRITAKVDAAQVGTLAIGEYVVAGASSALGTKDLYPLVKEGTPTTFKWRVIRNVTGTGVAGDLVLIERIS